MQAGKALLRKVKGTENPANYLTKPQPGRGSHRLGEAFGKARAGKPAQSVEAGFPNQPFCGNRQCHLGTADPRSEGAAEGIKRNSSGGPFRRPCCWGEPEEEPSEPTSEPKEEAEDTLPAEEPPAEVATPPIAVEDLFRTPARAAPSRDLRPPGPEPEPHHGDAGAAAAAQPARVRLHRHQRHTTLVGCILRPHATHGTPLQELCGTGLGTTEGHHHRTALPQLPGRDDHRKGARGQHSLPRGRGYLHATRVPNLR